MFYHCEGLFDRLRLAAGEITRVELRMIGAGGGKPVIPVKLFGGQGTINVNSWAPDSPRFADARCGET